MARIGIIKASDLGNDWRAETHLGKRTKMRTARTTFFQRLVVALDRDTVEKILRIEADVDTSGMSRIDMNYALIAADGNGLSERSKFIRHAILDYVKDVL